MVRGMLEEVRRAPLDDAGRRALREIHEKSLHELEGVLSPELQQELEEVVLPFTSETPSESELRIAQAQLVGWLEGLFHGIQATLFTQQAMAQQQLSEIGQRRAHRAGRPRRAAARRLPLGRDPMTALPPPRSIRPGRPTPGARGPPRSSRTGPTDGSLDAVLAELGGAPAARVRGRGALAHRVARARRRGQGVPAPGR